MKEPLVSIVVPTYNVERYIEECLDSLLAQSYKNIEYIIIDDASSDATPYLMKTYEDKMHIVRNKKNNGQGAVRNQGLSVAKGAYVLFVDSDDWIEPDTVRQLVEKAVDTKSDLVRFNGVSFNDNEHTIKSKAHYNFSSILSKDQIYEGKDLLVVNQKSYSASPCLYLVKKDLLEQNKILFPEGLLHEDEYFSTMVFVHSTRMSYSDNSFYHRRYRVASTMTENTPLHIKKSFESYIEIFKLLEEEYQSEKFNLNQKAFIKRQLLSIYHGLKSSKVEQSEKKSLKNFKTIGYYDKIKIVASLLKSTIKSKMSL